MHLSHPLCTRCCSLISWCFGTFPISQPIAVVPLWTSFSQHQFSVSGSNCCSLAFLCCSLLASTTCVSYLDIPQASLSPNSASTHCGCLSTVSRPRTRQPLMRTATPLLLAMAPGVTSVALAHLRIKLADARNFAAQFVPGTNFWNEWLGSATSLSHRAPKLPCSLSHPARTFRSPGVTPDLCHVQWHALPSREARSHWHTHFSSAGDSLFSDDFFHSLSVSRLSLPCTNQADSMLPSFTTNSLPHCSRCHESALGDDCLPYSLFKVSFPRWRHLVISFFNLVFPFAVVPSAWLFRSSAMVTPLLLVLRFQSVRAPDLCSQGFRWGADGMAFNLVDTLRVRRHKHTFADSLTLGRLLTPAGSKPLLSVSLIFGVSGRLSALTSKFPVWHPVPVHVWVALSLRHGSTLAGPRQNYFTPPLLFNLLVDNLAATFRSAIPGVSTHRFCSLSSRLPTLNRRLGHFNCITG